MTTDPLAPRLGGKKKGSKTRNDPLGKQSQPGDLRAKSEKNLKQSPLRKAFTRKAG